MTLREAIEIAGNLSHPSKMPCPCWSISQKHCITGARQAQQPGTVCSKCYAARGRYLFPHPQRAMERRLKGIDHPRWVEAMVKLITEEANTHFRWFDSGDIQSYGHLVKIIEIAKQLPQIKFWLPTQEQLMVKDVKPPKNLTIRVTAPKINPTKLPKFPHIAVVVESSKFDWDKLVECNTNDLWHCPADGTGSHKCGACRACWDKDVKRIAYRKK